jgi:DNA/RNA-binding domain of Phe-tRNA-synthetase-like protein
MWFVLESLDTMPQQALDDAASMLVDGLKVLMPGCTISRKQISIGA